MHNILTSYLLLILSPEPLVLLVPLPIPRSHLKNINYLKALKEIFEKKVLDSQTHFLTSKLGPLINFGGLSHILNFIKRFLIIIKKYLYKHYLTIYNYRRQKFFESKITDGGETSKPIRNGGFDGNDN